MTELYAYVAYKLNQILEYLVENIPTLVKQPTIKVDQAVIESLDRITSELTRNDSAAIEIEGTLCSTIDDIISGKPCIRRSVLQEFELLNQIVQGNAEINKDIRISRNGITRYNTYAFSSRLASICLDVMKKIQNKQGLCPAYHNWGILLGALYKLHVPYDWLYAHGYGRYYYADSDLDQRLVPYCNMELEEVLVDPKEYVRVIYDDDLYKLMQCKRTANRPDNELIRAYVNTFYTVQDTNQECCMGTVERLT
jgi:rRNA-processing protein FCF1